MWFHKLPVAKEGPLSYSNPFSELNFSKMRHLVQSVKINFLLMLI